MAEPKRILILGGTGEARRLADRLAAETRFDVETSLAGVTASPAHPAGRVRTGGFGGAAGLADHLTAARIDLLVDATHPFADTISRHAAEAAATTGTARLVIERPEWAPQDGDRWIEAADVEDAAAKAPALGRRAFLSIGRQEVDAFAGCPGLWCLVRVVDLPATPFRLPNHSVVTGRGPFDAAAEADLLRAHRIDLVVSKNSGGDGTRAKIDAARSLGLPVLMIRRPAPPPPPVVPTVEAALAWIAGRYP